jgi:hypothetical protein
MRTATLLLTLALLGAAGCGAHEPGPVDAGPVEVDAGPPDAGTFVAVLADVANYRSWHTIVIPSGETGEGDRTVYVNRLPPAGSRSFPVGTILIKESLVFGLHPSITVDGMVKHGGDYNLDGGQPFPDAGSDGGTAIGWAFMGLTPPDDAGAGVSILWQAPFPPPNAGYGPTNGDCNGCHHDAQANDYVKITDDDAGFWASGELMLSHD